MQTGFRILGECLDIDNSYLDVEVGGVDEDGTIYLIDPNSEDVWKFTTTEIVELADNLCAIGAGNIPFPDHTIWDDLDSIGQTRKSTDMGHVVDNYLKQSQEMLFFAIIEAGR